MWKKFNIKEIKQTTECFENNDIYLFYIGNIFNKEPKNINDRTIFFV